MQKHLYLLKTIQDVTGKHHAMFLPYRRDFSIAKSSFLLPAEITLYIVYE